VTPEAILTSFSLGLLAMTSPCVLPLYPGFLAYLSASAAMMGGAEMMGGAQQMGDAEMMGGNNQATGRVRSVRWLGFFVLGGVLVMMLALGLLISLLSISIGRALSIFIPLADLAILALGILLVLDINPFKSLPQIQVPVLRHPYLNAFVYGLLYGPIALPCSGPLVVSIFALSFTAEELVGRMSVFLWFGLGFGLPLLVLSLLSGAAQKSITRTFARHGRLINLAGGLLLIGIAIYDLTLNWELIRTYF
jgi:cytochrome c-type biogenesis protein